MLEKLFLHLIPFTIVLCSTVVGLLRAQTPQDKNNDLPVRYEELNALQFEQALKKARSTCIIPFGVLEKHGPHLPLGTDLLNVRALVLRAVEKEYSLVFPEYYFGQIFEAKHQPGTIAYSHRLIWDLLQETCAELARNGIKKIIIVNGHGGNNNFLKYFVQAQLEKKRDYALYLYTAMENPELEAKLSQMRKTEFDGHAGEVETSTVMVHRPDLVQTGNAARQSGENQKRLDHLKQSFTGIWWYARYPNHYAGDGTPANRELGEIQLEGKAVQVAEMIKEVKQDTMVLRLQERFFKESENPLNTEQ